MAVTLAISVDQVDNGETITITDTSNWANTAATGVTNVTIGITYDGTLYAAVVNENFTPPCTQSQLTWDIDCATKLSVDVPIDGKITISYVVTGSDGGTLTKDVLLDYNSKLWEYTKYKDMPYSFRDGNPAFNTYVQDAALASVLVEGMQYSAEVGQEDKMNFILGTINNLIDAE
jgi:hypothetical protein